MSNKVSTQLLVSPHTRDRSRALAIVRRESVAEVNRTALEASGLKGLERQSAGELAALHDALDYAAGKYKSDAMEVMLKRKMRLEDLMTDSGPKPSFPW